MICALYAFVDAEIGTPFYKPEVIGNFTDKDARGFFQQKIASSPYPEHKPTEEEWKMISKV